MIIVVVTIITIIIVIINLLCFCLLLLLFCGGELGWHLYNGHFVRWTLRVYFATFV